MTNGNDGKHKQTIKTRHKKVGRTSRPAPQKINLK